MFLKVWLQEILLPYIIKAMVHEKEKLTWKEESAKKNFLDSIMRFFTIQPGKVRCRTKKPIIVGMIGLIGSGKSSVAQELASHIGATVIEGDVIRILLRKEKEKYDNTRKIAEDVGLEIIKASGNVIFDSDHIDSKKRASLRSKAKEAKTQLIFVRTYAEIDNMIGRNMKESPNEFFSGASTPWQGSAQERGTVVKLREMIRRIPHHYRWTNKTGGRLILKKLPFMVFAEIDTTLKWKNDVKKIAEKILKRF
ncbi:dephospho-CoA kinase [Patescibacteria group bacterium]|nr:dephospho-CoA kinase [Patescibacteria group bacterium]